MKIAGSWVVPFLDAAPLTKPFMVMGCIVRRETRNGGDNLYSRRRLRIGAEKVVFGERANQAITPEKRARASTTVVLPQLLAPIR
ncbi:hypothetical protein [Mesorhizobium sp.]|uniref:hypothetical protein n=1 Tax=Mesorhizobium sp. TaxID=1871066 RepID=UPI0025C6BDF4|nr:hypothetical protein [Mesorhizobium sp.]